MLRKPKYSENDQLLIKPAKILVAVLILIQMSAMRKKMLEAVFDQFLIIYIKHLIGKDETPDTQTFLEGETFEYFFSSF